MAAAPAAPHHIWSDPLAFIVRQPGEAFLFMLQPYADSLAGHDKSAGGAHLPGSNHASPLAVLVVPVTSRWRGVFVRG